MTAPDDPRAIAGKLTDAQKRLAASDAWETQTTPFQGLHPDQLSAPERRVADRLVRIGLLEFYPGDWSFSQARYRFTPLGLQVRAILTGDSA